MDFSRRLLFAYIVTVLIQPDRSWLQLILLMYLNQSYTMFILFTKTYEDRHTQIIETLNEIIVMLTIYHFFCFTHFVRDAAVRFGFVSSSMIMMTVLNMSVNLIPVAFEILKNLKTKAGKQYKKVRRYFRKKKNEK